MMKDEDMDDRIVKFWGAIKPESVFPRVIVWRGQLYLGTIFSRQVTE